MNITSKIFSPGDVVRANGIWNKREYRLIEKNGNNWTVKDTSEGFTFVFDESFLTKKGRFIAIEGPNLAGKSTLLRAIENRLLDSDRKAVFTYEPGGSELFKALRKILKDATYNAGPFSTALIFEGGRRDHVDKIINPNVAQGNLVFTDRYWISTDIYQIAIPAVEKRMSKQEEALIHQIHNSFPLPDLTVFFIPSNTLLKSRGLDLNDRFFSPGIEAEAYRKYAREFAQKHPTLIVEFDVNEESAATEKAVDYILKTVL